MIQNNYPLLAQTYAQVANVRIRHLATVGGNLVAADYSSDPPTALIALGARVRLVSVGGERLVPVQEFITGHYQLNTGQAVLAGASAMTTTTGTSQSKFALGVIRNLLDDLIPRRQRPIFIAVGTAFFCLLFT